MVFETSNSLKLTRASVSPLCCKITSEEIEEPLMRSTLVLLKDKLMAWLMERERRCPSSWKVISVKEEEARLMPSVELLSMLQSERQSMFSTLSSVRNIWEFPRALEAENLS